jgi:hypothetical protein
MFKKGLVTLVCLTVMSAVCAWAATSYSVRTQLTNTGGTIKVGSKATQLSGIQYTNCTSAVSVVVAPNAGYKISALKQINGTLVTDITPADGSAQTVVIAKPLPLDPKMPAVLKQQGVTATFASTNVVAGISNTWQLQLKNNNAGGSIVTQRAGSTDTTVTMVGYPKLLNFTDTTPVAAIVTAQAGYKISSVSTDGVITKNIDDTVWTITGIPAANKTVNSVMATYQKLAFAVTTNSTPLVANGIAPMNPMVASGGSLRFIITPTGANNIVKTVTATGGTIALTDRFGKDVTLPFQGPVKATISNITSAITVAATYGVDTTASMLQNCTNSCHLEASVSASVKAVPFKWYSSQHKANGVDCISCHQTMPGPVLTEALCASCHIAGPTPNALHTAAQNVCSTCHTFGDVHNPTKAAVAGTITVNHTGGSAYGTAAPRAQYVSATVTCSNCHVGANAEIMAEFKASAHADINGMAWKNYDWRSASRAACQRCHVGTVFAAKVDDLNNTTNYFAAAAAGKPSEVLNCGTCHSDVAAGTPRAAASAFTVNLTNGATVSYDVPGASAICARCHGGRETGDSIKLDADVDGVRGFLNSHYLTAGGTVYNKTGYEFDGQSYDNLGYHKNVGSANVAGTGTNGPCVACHMSEGHGHTWDFVTKDVDGKITANNSTACVKCHDSLTGVKLQATKDSLQASLDALKAALEAKGIYFYEAHPYFYTAPYQAYTPPTVNPNVAFTNWAGVYGLASWKDVMGAAFNYNLVKHDPGAYAHNRQYAQKLIFDSIDFLNDGLIDNDGGVVAPSTVAGHSATFVAHTAAGSMASATNAANVTTSACAACHNNATAAQLAKNVYIDDIADRFATSAHGEKSARAGFCSACHSHEGFMQQVALGKTETYGALNTAYTVDTTNGVYALPVAGTTFVGVTKKNCATCHDPASSTAHKLRGAGDTVATGLLPANGSTFAVDTTRVTFSAEFNLCTACHQVKLDATFVPADGYTGRGMFKYELASTYSAENLLDAPGGTFKTNWLNDLPYHAESGTSRKYIDTHYNGTMLEFLATGDATKNGNIVVAGYNINPGSADACTVCHDAHTAGKLLSVTSGGTVAYGDDNTNQAISYANGLGGFHTNYEADPFSRVATGCTPCHTGKDFPRLTTGATVATLGTPGWSVVGCASCHNLAQANATPAVNNSAAFADVREFPAGYEFKFAAASAAAVPVADLGDNAVCFECHKGRVAGADVDAMADPVAGTQNYAISYLHYAPSAAILYGADSKMVAAYTGKSYTGRFQHPVAVGGKTNFSCTDCHNVHTGGNYFASASCVGCHDGATAPLPATMKADVRAFSERLLDTVLASVIAADGTVGLNATLQAKITAIKAEADPAVQKELLMTYIEERQVYFPSKRIAQAAVAWKVFTYEDGAHDGQAHGHGGSWAHNAKFAKQVMFDAIENLGGDLTGLSRPTL